MGSTGRLRRANAATLIPESACSRTNLSASYGLTTCDFLGFLLLLIPQEHGIRRVRFQMGSPDGYFRDMCTRISTESDVTKLVPHGWKEHYWPQLQESRDEIVQ